MNISHVLEIARFIGVFAGFWAAFSKLSDPKLAFHWLSVCVVVSIAGMAGIESLLFGKRAAAASGYSDPGPTSGSPDSITSRWRSWAWSSYS
jgi:hypothetical protein